MTGGRIAALIIGLIIALVGALFAFGGWAITNAEALTDPLTTAGQAIIVSTDALVGGTDLSPEEQAELADFEFTFTIESDRPVAVGTGTATEVEAIFANVERLAVNFDENSVTTSLSGSDRVDVGDVDFWQDTSTTATSVSFPLSSEDPKQIVIMNADSADGVDVQFGFDFSSMPFVGTFAAIALGGGIVAVLFGLGLAAWAVITRKKGNETVPDPLGWDN